MNGGNPVRPRRGELNIRQLFVREQHLPALDVIAFIDLHVRIEIDIIRAPAQPRDGREPPALLTPGLPDR